MAKKIISLLMIIIMITLLCSCSDDDGVTLLVPIKSDPMCLDPQAADTDSAKLIVNNCFEGLVRLGENYEILPGVAESWKVSGDGKTYTFKLRENTNWQLLKSYSTVLEDENYMENFDTTVKAKDFVFALQRAVDPVTKCTDADKLLCIRNAEAINNGSADKDLLGVKAIDDFNLVITLDRANPDFLRILTMPMCMPCNEEFFVQTKAHYGMELKYTFCNGPFYLARWADDNIVSIIKNEGYKGEANVKPDGVSFVVNSDEDSVNDKLKQSSYDCAFVSDSMFEKLGTSKKITFKEIENTVTGLCFNCNDEVLKNSNIRKAIALLTKTGNVTKPEDASSAAKGVVPDCVRMGEKKYRDTVGKVSGLPYDEHNAKALWKIGLDELKSESENIIITCTEEYSAQMQHIIQSWQKVLGTTIVAKVDIKTKDEIEENIALGKFQIVVKSITSKTSNVTDLLSQFTSGNEKNIFNYSDPIYDKMVENIIHTANGNDIINQCKNAEVRLIDEGVFCPLFNYTQRIAIRKDVSGIYTSPAFDTLTFISGDVD